MRVGPNLFNTLRVKGAQPLVDVLGIGREVALQLRAAHRRGLVHGQITLRSVQPKNGEWLLHFPTPPPLTRGLRLNRPTLNVGNLAWVLAPEQLVDGRPPFDPPVDLYALGVILYELASGSSIYRSLGGTMDAVRAKLDGDLVPLAERDASLPAWFTGFVDDLLARDPEQRPRADEAARLLQREHDTALLARHRPRRTTPPPGIPALLGALYEVVHPIGPTGRSGQVWSFLARARGGGPLVVLHVSHDDDLTEVVPFREGESLATRLKRLGSLPTSEVIALGQALVDELERLPGPHGCLTPERVRIDFDERFHLSHPVSLQRRHPVTEVEPLELSPEHLTRCPDLTVARHSDLYGLGVVLFAAATGGELPYPGADRLSRMRDLRDGRRVRLRERARVPRRLERLVHGLLDPWPARRPKPAQIRRDLSRC